MSVEFTAEMLVKVTCQVKRTCSLCGQSMQQESAPTEIKYSCQSNNYTAGFSDWQWDWSALKALAAETAPEGWVSRKQSQMFSGEGHYTEWTDWYCPDCWEEESI